MLLKTFKTMFLDTKVTERIITPPPVSASFLIRLIVLNNIDAILSLHHSPDIFFSGGFESPRTQAIQISFSFPRTLSGAAITTPKTELFKQQSQGVCNYHGSWPVLIRALSLPTLGCVLDF